MELRTLSCCNCGASLEIPSGLGFVTCKHCQSSLEVQESKDVSFTKLAKGIKRQTGEILEEVQLIRLQNRLERLDREWGEYCKIPRIEIGPFRKEHTVIFLSIVGAFCITAISAMIYKMKDWHFVMMGIFVVALLSNPFGFFFEKAKDARKEKYELERLEIINKIEEIIQVENNKS